MRNLPLLQNPVFFQGLELANTVYDTSIHLKNINHLQYFAMLLDNKIYSSYAELLFKNYDSIFNKLCKKKSFNQTITFVSEKLRKKW